jgi:hypothetical protein
MSDAGETGKEISVAGLCATCANVRRIESDRGTRFYLCGLAAADPSFRKYPALPIIVCRGYVKAPES